MKKHGIKKIVRNFFFLMQKVPDKLKIQTI